MVVEEKELLEIEAREREQAKKNVDEMVQRKNISDIYLLYKDKFDLEKKRACLSLSNAPLQLLIPLYERILVPIPPYSSLEKFNEDMGFSVTQLVEWRKRGWVETLLNGPPMSYTGLSYLDELIQVSPSKSIREQVYVEMLVGGVDRLKSILYQGGVVFKESVEPPVYVEFFGEQIAKRYRVHLATLYASLSLLGLRQIVRTINGLARRELKYAEEICILSSIFLVAPFLDSLKKTTVYDSESKALASRYYELAKPKAEAFFVPCWLADVYQNLGATVPSGMGTDEIEVLRKNSEEFIRAMKSLDEEVDKTVREKFEGQELEIGEKEAILAKKEEFRKRWFDDVVPSFEDIRETEEVLSITMTGSIVAPAIELAAFAGVFGIPAAIAALAASRKIKELVDPAAEYLATFWERNPIHLGFYKVQKEVRKLKHKDR